MGLRNQLLLDLYKDKASVFTMQGIAMAYGQGLERNTIKNYCCPLKVSEQRDIHPQCCCNGIADDFSEGKPLS